MSAKKIPNMHYIFRSILILFFTLVVLSNCTINSTQGSHTVASKETKPPRESNPPNGNKKEISTLDWSNIPNVLTSGNATTLLCGTQTVDLLPYIKNYADSITNLNLKYDQATKNDCSGTFIKMNQYLNKLCPANTFFPSFDKVRSSSDLVAYYHQLGDLIFIEDPLKSDHLIVPGAVLFYTHRDRGGKLKVNATNMQALVNHVGVVYEVKRDPKTGNVISYSLFHGRNPKRGINITNYHNREPFGQQYKAYPYGNGTEQWMAVAVGVHNGG